MRCSPQSASEFYRQLAARQAAKYLKLLYKFFIMINTLAIMGKQACEPLAQCEPISSLSPGRFTVQNCPVLPNSAATNTHKMVFECQPSG